MQSLKDHLPDIVAERKREFVSLSKMLMGLDYLPSMRDSLESLLGAIEAEGRENEAAVNGLPWAYHTRTMEVYRAVQNARSALGLAIQLMNDPLPDEASAGVKSHRMRTVSSSAAISEPCASPMVSLLWGERVRGRMGAILEVLRDGGDYQHVPLSPSELHRFVLLAEAALEDIQA